MTTRDSRQHLRVVFAGGRDHRKGSDVAAATAEILASRELAEVWWFGEHPRLPNGLQMRKFGRLPRNEFLDKLGQADILLLPSRAEGCSMVLLEGMRAGLIPLVSFEGGASKELIENGQTGFVLPLRKYRAEAVGVVEFLKGHSSRIDLLRANVRASAQGRLSIKRTALSLLELTAAPTVDRTIRKSQVRVVKWTRKPALGGSRAPLVDRLSLRLGLLSVEPHVDVTA